MSITRANWLNARTLIYRLEQIEASLAKRAEWNADNWFPMAISATSQQEAMQIYERDLRRQVSELQGQLEYLGVKG